MTWDKIINNPLIDKRECVKNYDGAGRHLVVCVDGYRFEGERTIEIGSLSEITYSINNNLEKHEPTKK